MDRRSFLRGTTSASALAAVSLAIPGCQNTAGARNNSVFNVLDFGACGDGKASDTAAIQKALDTAGEAFGTVFFPAGVYNCHDLKVPAYVKLEADPVWLYKAESVGAVLQLDDPGADCVLDITDAFGVHIYGLVISGISDAKKRIHGIYQHNEDSDVPHSDNGWSKKEDTFVFDDIKVMKFSGHGIYLKNIWLFIVRHSHLAYNAGDGMRIRGWDGFVTDNQFSGNGGNGFGCESTGATVMFTANRVEWNRGYGLYVCNGDDWNVTGNSFDRNYEAGMCLDNVKAVAVTGNVFRRCGKDSGMLSEGEKSCQIRLEGCKGLSMTGNTCLAGQDDGGVGKFTPQVGFIIKNLACSVISGNTLSEGYMDQLVVDYGGHGKDFIFKDNVGSPKVK